MSLSLFKKRIFEDAAIATTILPMMSLHDILVLLEDNPKYLKHPTSLKRKSGLIMIWDLILQYHWKDFIRSNAFHILQKMYKWDQYLVVDRMFARIKQFAKQEGEKQQVDQKQENVKDEKTQEIKQNEQNVNDEGDEEDEEDEEEEMLSFLPDLILPAHISINELQSLYIYTLIPMFMKLSSNVNCIIYLQGWGAINEVGVNFGFPKRELTLSEKLDQKLLMIDKHDTLSIEFRQDNTFFISRTMRGSRDEQFVSQNTNENQQVITKTLFDFINILETEKYPGDMVIYLGHITNQVISRTPDILDMVRKLTSGQIRYNYFGPPPDNSLSITISNFKLTTKDLITMGINMITASAIMGVATRLL